MRIVEYNGVPVKRQSKIGPDAIKIVFYDNRPPIVVTGKEWRSNSRSKYFDDPNVRRSDVVHRQVAAY